MNLFLLLCFNGFVTTAVYIKRAVHHQYHLILTPATWYNARNYCRVRYTDLATIVTKEDVEKLREEAADKNMFDFAWTGLYNDINGWRWTLNELPLKSVTYKNWKSGQPDNYAGKESCSLINTNGLWTDYPCTTLIPFICYNASFSGSAKFISISTPSSWVEAQNYCRTHHTDLASSLNSSDNDLLLQLVNIQGDSWFGLYRDTWKWSDGTDTTIIRWCGTPSNSASENCVKAHSGTFHSETCSTMCYFLCHTIIPVKEQQIVRLQVKSDGSVLDPAVQSAILEQVKQKMKEKGMLENSTVTWRVQPNGNIFQKKNKNYR